MVGFVYVPDVLVSLHNAYHFVTVVHGLWNIVTHLISEDLKGYFLLGFVETPPQAYPDAWLFTFKIKNRCVKLWIRSQISPIPVFTLVVAFIIVVLFIFLVVIFLFCSFFCHFRLTPWWEFEPCRCSWFLNIFLLQNHTLANRNKVFLLYSSCSYIVR